MLLSEHLPCIGTLPPGDADFPKRWGLIKARFSKQARALFRQEAWINPSKAKHRESTLWQRRFWEHQIRNQDDFIQHLDYIHWDPVKHGHVTRVVDWPYSTFHRYVAKGIYALDWGGGVALASDASDILAFRKMLVWLQHVAEEQLGFYDVVATERPLLT